MHDGYDRDDIFIMVEDEFQTVAQSYTAHLHHAEYKRLVKQAREAPPKALPEPTSPMSKQTRNRLKAVALEKRQKESLRRVTGQKSNGEQEDEDKAADLWSGTSLAPLMANSSQQKRSLLGLEGISSSTKAGLGVGRSQSSRRFAADEETDTLGLDITSHKSPMQQKDVVSTARPRRVGENGLTQNEATTPRMIEKHVSEPVAPPTQSKPEARPITKRKFFYDSDDMVDQPKTRTKLGVGTQKLTSTKLSNGNSLLRRRPTDEQEKKTSRLDEVPLFIP